MSIPSHIFKSYDIRGIYPTELNEEFARPIAKAFFKLFTQKLQKEDITIAVSHDMRISSPAIRDAVIDTLVSLGARVVDLGMCSTPTFYFGVFHNKYDAGIQITASHNPKDYNGLKAVLYTPKGLIKIGKSTGMEDIKKMVLESNLPDEKEGGIVMKKEGTVEEEVDNALTLLNIHPDTLKKFTVVADPANAMAILYLEELFARISSDLHKLNFELDGTFPAHQADPLQFETLVDLQKEVKEKKADFGLAPDGDGDRLFFIDEKGEVVPASYVTAIVAREFLKENPGETILYDIRYILTPQKIVEENGGKSIITKVGHAFITEELTNSGGIFAGESSAHYFYRSSGNAENQVITILTVMKVLSRENKKLSELVEEVRRSYESGEINFEVTNAAEIMDALKEKYSDGELSTLDGIAITYPEWRFSVRTSNTEPLMRLNLESYKKEVMEEKRDEIIQCIKEHNK